MKSGLRYKNPFIKLLLVVGFNLSAQTFDGKTVKWPGDFAMVDVWTENGIDVYGQEYGFSSYRDSVRLRYNHGEQSIDTVLLALHLQPDFVPGSRDGVYNIYGVYLGPKEHLEFLYGVYIVVENGVVTKNVKFN